MSTDVYFDFHSQETAPLLLASIRADGTHRAWCNKVDELEAKTGIETHYCPCPVAHLSTLVLSCNYDLWGNFCQRWHFATVTNENIPAIVADWTVMYDNAQRPENAANCLAEEIATPTEVEADLLEHLGYVLDPRID